MSDLPSHTYYRACVGSWRAPISLQVRDLAALGTSGMSWMDRWSVRLMAVWPSWLGAVTMATTVAYDPAGVVAHTTDAVWLGLPLMHSVETITLAADGRTFTMTGSQRVGLAVWAARPLSGHGTVDADARTAVYELQWLGVNLRQSTVRDRDVVTVSQEGPGFTGVQRLVRQ